jgi:Ca2+-binding EF-hand superfamily protein
MVHEYDPIEARTNCFPADLEERLNQGDDQPEGEGASSHGCWIKDLMHRDPPKENEFSKIVMTPSTLQDVLDVFPKIADEDDPKFINRQQIAEAMKNPEFKDVRNSLGVVLNHFDSLQNVNMDYNPNVMYVRNPDRGISATDLEAAIANDKVAGVLLRHGRHQPESLFDQLDSALKGDKDGYIGKGDLEAYIKANPDDTKTNAFVQKLLDTWDDPEGQRLRMTEGRLRGTAISMYISRDSLAHSVGLESADDLRFRYLLLGDKVGGIIGKGLKSVAETGIRVGAEAGAQLGDVVQPGN